METSSHSNRTLMFGLLGFAIGMLFAPDKGNVTRDKLKNQAETFADKAQHQKESAKRKLQSLRGKKDQVASDFDESIDKASADIMP